MKRFNYVDYLTSGRRTFWAALAIIYVTIAFGGFVSFVGLFSTGSPKLLTLALLVVEAVLAVWLSVITANIEGINNKLNETKSEGDTDE